MGANVSTSENVVNDKSLNTIVNNYMQSSSNDVKNTIGSEQVNEIDIGDGATIACNINLSNTTGVSAIAKGTISTTSTTNLQNDLKSQLSSDFQKAASQTAGLSFGAANADVTTNKINQEVDNVVTNTVTQTSIQKIMNSIYTIQDNKMVIGKGMTCLPGATITMNNTAVLGAFATAMTASIMDATSKNTTLTEISSKYKETVKQTVSIFAGLGGLVVVAIIGAAIAGMRSTKSCGINCHAKSNYLKASEANRPAILASCEEMAQACKTKRGVSKRTKMIMIVLIGICLIVGGIIIWKLVKSTKKVAHTAGDLCFPSDKETSNGVLTYTYTSTGTCVANTCNQILGYELNTTSDGCDLKTGWSDPLPDGSECRTTSASDTINFCTDDNRKAADDSAKMKDNNICETNTMTTCSSCKDGKDYHFCGANLTQPQCDTLCSAL